MAYLVTWTTLIIVVDVKMNKGGLPLYLLLKGKTAWVWAETILDTPAPVRKICE